MDKKQEKIVNKTIEDLLRVLSIEAQYSVVFGQDVIEVVLQTEESGIVIGYHGEILESLQLILSLCISKELGVFTRVSLEVGDYKKNRVEWLESLAGQTKERVLLEGKEVSMPSLKSWERRVVHLYFENDEDVMSESVGEGRDRTLVIKPR